MSGRYMHPTLAHDMAETVSLYLGKPANCCLKFARGLRRDTVRGPRVLFTLTDDRKLWVDPPVADRIEALVGAGEWFHICKRKSPGNSQVEVYDVWTGERGQPAAEMAPAEAWENNIEETLQESVKRGRAKKASAAKIGELKAAPAIVDVDEASDNSHATPERAPTQLVEVARSYTFKLNVGNYESRDFFCSQKAECKPEDAESVSDRLYAFCKRQVMKAVAEERASAA